MNSIKNYLIVSRSLFVSLALMATYPIVTDANANSSADINSGSNIARLSTSTVTSSIHIPLVLTPLNAQFETIECGEPCKKPKISTWWMWRTPTQVELKKANSHNSERWTWENNHVTYQFLMHEERKVIEYSSVDLKMLNMTIDNSKWQEVTNLVLQKDLARMQNKHLKRQHKGLALMQYDGKIQGIKSRVVWIPSLQIPLQMTYFYPKQKITINLVSQDTQMTTGAINEQALDGYQRIDFADIGDMEHSAYAKKWLIKAEDAPGMHIAHH